MQKMGKESEDKAERVLSIYTRLKQGKVIYKENESKEYAYSIEQLTQYLKAAGFTHIRVYADGRLEQPRAGEQRIYFSARKGIRK